jgi:hypothetical protein
MRVSHVDGPAPQSWDDAVRASADAWLFHDSRWIAATAEVFSLVNHFFIIEEAGRVIAGMPLQVTRGGRRLTAWPQAFSLFMGGGGPLAVDELEPDRRAAAREAVCRAAVEWAKGAKIGRLECQLPPLAAARNVRDAHGLNPLVKLGWQDRSTQTLVKDLTGPGGQLAGIDADARRLIRRAGERGYTVARESWLELLDAYYQTHVETYQRTGAPPHPRGYFEAIAREIASWGGAVLWVCRTAEGEPVAFHNCGRFVDGSVYWTGCSRKEHARAGVNYLLFWHAIAGARDDGCRYYDVGEVFPETADEKRQGLTTFKTKFGGQPHPLFRGQYLLWPRGFWIPWLQRARRPVR